MKSRGAKGVGQTQNQYDPSEQDDLITRFTYGLRSVTRDGGRKRAAGEKPPWYEDDSHWPAVFSHYRKHLLGEKVDPDSGVNPLWHMAWRVCAEAAKMDSNYPNGRNDMFNLEFYAVDDSESTNDRF